MNHFVKRMIAIIDIGSNTVRMNVYQIEDNEKFNVLFSVKEMAGLASQIESGLLLEKGLKNLILILSEFRRIVDIFHIKEVYPFATASLRLISNQASVLQRIFDETGFSCDLISGSQEGKLGVIGALSDFDVPKAVLVDVGGGSCEIVPFENKKILSSNSYPVGSLSMYKQFTSTLIPNHDEQKKIKKFVKQEIDGSLIKKHQFVTVVGVGGTIRALLKVKNYIDNDFSGSRQLTLKKLKSMLAFLGSGSREAQDTILKVVPDRIHTLVSGLCVWISVLNETGCVEVLVSENGVREGYLIEHVLNQGDVA